MTEVYRRMLNDDEYDSPEKCRERRRRRIEMRRLAAGGSPQPINPQISKEKKQAAGGRARVQLPRKENGLWGWRVDFRWRSQFLGACQCQEGHPEVNRRRPVHLFGVFDGHGGAHVAALCRERMHVLIEEELARVDLTRLRSESGDGGAEWEEMWRGVMKRSYERMDEVAMGTCACGSMGFKCGCHPMQMALGGSTAVVAVLSPEHIIVANCGDSRAALSRGGRAIPLSVDHKPDRSDELARIEAAGGRVIFLNGARVEGILAMSRAIGDKYLKPVVIAEPEITFTQREPEDECLILASDGLWDVMSSDLACQVARECLRAANAGPQIEDEGAAALYPSRSMLAAALLTRLALGRRSADNISVIVVDLKRS
uniref:protein-serine/threonine phosphatase n=1 Tax=Salix viminalis TaxID=40686 RepID=A0A6N2KBS3_SALVM